MTDNATEIAKATVVGLSSSPVLLLVAVLNVVMILAMVYVAKSQADERQMLREREAAVVKLLVAACGPKETH